MKLRVYLAPCGIGLGHITRVQPIGNELNRRGVETVYSTYLDGLDYARSNSLPTYEAVPISFQVTNNGAIDFKRTAATSGFSLGIRRLLEQVVKEIQYLKQFKPDVVLSDSRASSLLAARLLRIPVALVLNQFRVEIIRRPSGRRLTPLDRIFFFIANVGWMFVRTAIQLVWGVLTGAGALTRYAFGWSIIPVVVFLAWFGGQRRLWQAATALGAFAIVLSPWVIRNWMVSGTPFGTAGYALVEGATFTGTLLERSAHPDLTYVYSLKPIIHKFLANLRGILEDDVPRLGGSWASMFFLTGLLLGFRNLAARRLRYFLLMCLGTFVLFQALGQTELTTDSPEVNSENLIVLTVPLVFIYGAVFFLTLLRQMKLPVTQLRYAVTGLFVLVSCLPMVFALGPARNLPVAYPPYYPPDIQKTAGWMKESELMMSDVPWGVAWYGHHQCVWLTLNTQDEFNAISYWIKPVQAIYLTPETMDDKLLSECVRGGEGSWGTFLLKAMSQNQIASNFPLTHAPSGSAAISSGLFLTDRIRW